MTSFVITEPPSAPVISTVNSIDPQTIDVTWSEPVVTNGAIDGYIVTITRSVWIPSNSTSTRLNLTIDGNTTTYNVSVRAVNSYGTSEHSKVKQPQVIHG